MSIGKSACANIEHLSEQGSVLAWKQIMPVGVQVELALDPYSMFSTSTLLYIDGHHFWFGRCVCFYEANNEPSQDGNH